MPWVTQRASNVTSMVSEGSCCVPIYGVLPLGFSLCLCCYKALCAEAQPAVECQSEILQVWYMVSSLVNDTGSAWLLMPAQTTFLPHE